MDDITQGISGLSDSGAPQQSVNVSQTPPQDLPAGVTPVADQSAAPAPAPAPGPTSMMNSPTAQAAGNIPQQQPAGPTPNPNTPHAGLLNIVQNIALGLDSFGKSIATHGQEGGVQEVLQARAQQQDANLKQQANTRDNNQAQAMIQHTQAMTNATIAQTEINKINAPLEHQKLVIGNQDALYDLYVNKLHINPLFAVPIVQGQTTDTHMNAINQKANGDLVNNTVIPVHDDTVGGSGNSYGFSFDQLRKVNIPLEQAAPVLANLQNQITFAKSVLPNGEKDPAIQAAQGKLDVMKKGAVVNGFDFYNFDNQVQAQILSRVNNQKSISDFQEQQAKARTAQQEADPLFKMENDPSQMSGEKSSAAIPLLQNKLSDPATAPADKVRATRLLAQAQSAHSLFQQDQLQKANAEQAAKQGDPKAWGPMLANHDVTLADIKTRGMTGKGLQEAINSAKAVDPSYNPAMEVIAEQVSKSPQSNQFFGSANSLISKGGTLDQLMDAGSKLPNHQFPYFNKISDAENYASGHKEVAGYLQTALGVADDYAKVTGGGAGTEGMQMHILNSLTAALNQDTRKEVTDRMRGAVNSQVESKIGKNWFLNQQYGYALPQNQPKTAAAKPFDPSTEAHPIAQ
jgi:hypothetical protein